MYRVLKNYLPQLNVSMVIEFGGDKDAFELYYRNKWHVINGPQYQNSDLKVQAARDVWYSNIENLKIKQEKNTNAMRWICNQHQVPYYKFSGFEIQLDPPVAATDWSRCGHHAGPKFHTAAADYIADHIIL
jgi:hypothetical protein